MAQESTRSGGGEHTQTTGKLSIPASPHQWPLLGPAEPESIALLVIDMEVDGVLDGGWFTDMGFDLSLIRAIVPGLKDLLDAARTVPKLNIVHFTNSFSPDLSDLPDFKREQAIEFGTPYGKLNKFGRGMIHGEPGSGIIKELTPLAGEPVFNKTTYNVFGAEQFRNWIQEHDIRSLIITGVTSNVCVAASLYAAVDQGYDCLTISDGIAGVNTAVTENLLGLVRYQGGLFGAETPAATAARSLREFA
jgi:nicotinamidase-related amidase